MPLWKRNPDGTVRRARYAGSWYESNPDRLKEEIETNLVRAGINPDKESNVRLKVLCSDLNGTPLAIIVPHAGYFYSAATSAWAYKAASSASVKRVFLLGPSHQIGFRGAALPEAKKFATPLGDIEVDFDSILDLKKSPHFSTQALVHDVEHSLELQLPFIKNCFPEAKIIPVITGQLDDENAVRSIGYSIKRLLRKGDLIVVSSDFTHYGPRYDYTPFAGRDNTSELICEMDGKAFSYLSRRDLDGFRSFLDKTGDTICGMFPCQVLLSMLPQGSHGSLLKYSSSRDSTPEDSDNAVSYLAIVFSGAEWIESETRLPSQLIELNDDERRTLLKLARKTIEIFVKENRIPAHEELGLKITPVMLDCYGVFVTLSRKPEEDEHDEPKELRGCIGSIFPTQPLFKAVQDNAVAACSRDYRFPPVAVQELDTLRIDINVLTRPERLGSYKEIVIGRDGVILTKGKKQSVFLPQVALEWKWTLPEMLRQLSLKAGLGPEEWREGSNFDSFQSLEFHEQASSI